MPLGVCYCYGQVWLLTHTCCRCQLWLGREAGFGHRYKPMAHNPVSSARDQRLNLRRLGSTHGRNIKNINQTWPLQFALYLHPFNPFHLIFNLRPCIQASLARYPCLLNMMQPSLIIETAGVVLQYSSHGCQVS